MTIFNMPRHSGKTTMLIGISHLTNARIIVATKAQVNMITDLAEKCHLSIPKPMTINDYLYYGFRYNKEKILIDELDQVLNTIFHSEILAATRTGE